MAKGLGIAVVVFFLLISKAPRLLKDMFEDRKPPAPVQMPDKDARAIQELLEEARKKPPLQPVPAAKQPAIRPCRCPHPATARSTRLAASRTAIAYELARVAGLHRPTRSPVGPRNASGGCRTPGS